MKETTGDFVRMRDNRDPSAGIEEFLGYSDRYRDETVAAAWAASEQLWATAGDVASAPVRAAVKRQEKTRTQSTAAAAAIAQRIPALVPPISGSVKLLGLLAFALLVAAIGMVVADFMGRPLYLALTGPRTDRGQLLCAAPGYRNGYAPLRIGGQEIYQESDGISKIPCVAPESSTEFGRIRGYHYALWYFFGGGTAALCLFLLIGLGIRSSHAKHWANARSNRMNQSPEAQKRPADGIAALRFLATAFCAADETRAAAVRLLACIVLLLGWALPVLPRAASLPLLLRLGWLAAMALASLLWVGYFLALCRSTNGPLHAIGTLGYHDLPFRWRLALAVLQRDAAAARHGWALAGGTWLAVVIALAIDGPLATSLTQLGGILPSGLPGLVTIGEIVVTVVLFGFGLIYVTEVREQAAQAVTVLPAAKPADAAAFRRAAALGVLVWRRAWRRAVAISALLGIIAPASGLLLTPLVFAFALRCATPPCAAPWSTTRMGRLRAIFAIPLSLGMATALLGATVLVLTQAGHATLGLAAGGLFAFTPTAAASSTEALSALVLAATGWALLTGTLFRAAATRRWLSIRRV